MIYHVSVLGNELAAGTEDAPFRTINRAARIASPGDTVRVHEGTYREWVDPVNSGLSDVCRPVTTESLGTPRITEAPYAAPDGSPVDFTKDFFGNEREGNVIPGPFAKLSVGENRFEI